MARKLLYYPDLALRHKAQEVQFDPHWNDINPYRFYVKQLLSEMDEVLTSCENGVSLAATQVGIDLRMFVINESCRNAAAHCELDEQLRQSILSLPKWIINPYLNSGGTGKKSPMNESCLSLPGISMKVERFEKSIVVFQTIDNEQRVLELSGFWLQLFQHEIDHLDGKLMVDKLSFEKRLGISKIVQDNVRRTK